MSLTIIQRKLQELKEKEKKILDFYDPVKISKRQHPHIKDLRDDYQEDIQNYGFSRFAFKEEKDASMDEKDKRIQSAVPLNNRMTSPKGNASQYTSLKPQSASIRPTTAKKTQGEGGFAFQNQLASPNAQSASIRPTTAKKFGPDATVLSEFQMSSPKTIQSQFLSSLRPQTAMIQSNYNSGQAVRNIQSANQHGMQGGYDTINDRFMPEEQEHYNQEGERVDAQQEHNAGQEGNQKIKHWKFTKKYDTNGKQAVRNQSALKKIIMDGQGGEEEVQDEEELQQIQERAMANRFNGQKIFISKEGQVLGNHENHELNILRKYSPTEREKINFLDSFQSQKMFLKQGEVQFKKIYAAPQVVREVKEETYSHRKLTTENLTSDPSYRGIPSSLKLSSKEAGQRKKIERPQTAIGFSSSGNSMKNNNAGSKGGNVQFKKRINSSKPLTGATESIKLQIEDDQKIQNIKKIKSAVLDPDGPVKFFAAKDYTPLEFTEWYFSNQCN